MSYDSSVSYHCVKTKLTLYVYTFVFHDDYLVETRWISFVLDHLNGGDEPIVGVVGGEDRHRGEGLCDIEGEGGG